MSGAPRTLFTDEKIDLCIADLTSIIDMLNEIKTDNKVSMTSACKKRGLNYRIVRDKILKNLNSVNANPDFIDDIKPIEFSPYECLYKAIFGISDTEAANVLFPLDIEKTIDYAVQEFLQEREAYVIKMRFGLQDKYPHTLEEISKVLNISVNRVRQIECKALRKLRAPNRANILKVGLTIHEEKENLKAQLFEKQKQETIEKYKNQILVTQTDKAINTLSVYEVTNNTRIDSLKLSIRAYNCMSRYLYTTNNKYASELTIYDVLNISDEDLMKIRNLGKRSLEEVICKLNEFLEPYGLTRDQYRMLYCKNAKEDNDE